MDEPIRSADALWRFFVGRAGLEPDGWDAQLVEELRAALELGTGAADLERALVQAQTPLEDLLLALLRALEPFGAMLGDLLALFERAGIASGGQTAAIAFDFDRDAGELRFDLEAFRSARAVLARATAASAVRAWNHDTLWGLAYALGRELPSPHEPGRGLPAGGETSRWSELYRRERVWPSMPLPTPQAGHPELDARLRAVWDVWSWVFASARSLAPDRDRLRELRAARFSALEDSPDDALLHLVGAVDSDGWLGEVALDAHRLASHVRRSADGDAIAADAIDALDAALPEPTEEQHRVEQLVEQLEDILELPFWQRRHELFAAWVLTQIVDALEPAEVVLHDVDGVLRFRFAATHLATATLAGGAVSVWSEVRTPLEAPLGASRVRGIQPDYSLAPGDGGPFEPERSLVEIECKQYKRASTRAFAEALADYARGRPRATVLLVDAGPLAPERVLARPELEDLAHRTHPIGLLQPGRAREREQLALLVRGALWPCVAQPPALRVPVAAVGRLDVRLVCARTAAGAELHVRVATGAARDDIHERAPGRLDEPPFAAFQRRSESEATVVVERLTGETYDVVVRAAGVELPAGAAVVELAFARWATAFPCPRIEPGRWWHVARFERASGLTQLVDQVMAAPPS